MSGVAASPLRIFVSHSHSDNAYCRAFVAALRRVLRDTEAVWYDEHNLGWGDIRRTIERELEQRQHFMAILSPAAVVSQWVNDEIDVALGLLREGPLLTFVLVAAEKCDVPRLLRKYKRIEAAGGDGYPPAEAATRALSLIQPVGSSPSPATSPAPPPHSSAETHRRLRRRYEAMHRAALAYEAAVSEVERYWTAHWTPPPYYVDEAGPEQEPASDYADAYRDLKDARDVYQHAVHALALEPACPAEIREACDELANILSARVEYLQSDGFANQVDGEGPDGLDLWEPPEPSEDNIQFFRDQFVDAMKSHLGALEDSAR